MALASADYIPKLYHVGQNASLDGLSKYTGRDVTLDSSSPVLTLDYGSEVGGFPWVEVESPDGPVQIELKYSEPFDGLGMPYGDGPWYVSCNC